MNDTHLRHRSLSVGSALALLGGALAGCIGTQEATAEGALYVKDALTDEVAAVHVTFVAAEYLPAGADGWITVFAGERTIELLSLSAPLAREKLADIEIPPGEYTGLRIAVTTVETVDHEGERTALAVLGNVVAIGRPFIVHVNGSTDLVVDFDLEEGVDLENGTYAPFVRDIRSSREDADGDGLFDMEDADEIEREAPAQEHAMDQRGVFGLCAAWRDGQADLAQGEAEDSTAFVWLRQQGDAEGQTVEDYCAAQEPPIPSQAGGIFEVFGAPFAIRGDPEDIPRGRPEGLLDGGRDRMREEEPRAGERPEGARDGAYPGADAKEGAEREPYDENAYDDNVSTRAEPALEHTDDESPADGDVVRHASNERPLTNRTQETSSDGVNQTAPPPSDGGNRTAPPPSDGVDQTTPPPSDGVDQTAPPPSDGVDQTAPPPSDGGNQTAPQDAPQGNSSAGSVGTTPTRSGP